MTSIESGNAARTWPSPLRLGVWLALIFVGAKAVLLGWPRSWLWPFDLMRVSWRDVLLAVTVAGFAEIAQRMAANRPAGIRRIRVLFLSFCTLCVFYSVVSVGVFRYFDRPLSYELLTLVRDVSAVRSSIAERITLALGTALVGIPIMFLAFALCLWRESRVPVVALAVAGTWIAAGWFQTVLRIHPTHPRLDLSPHVELVRSTIAGLSGARRIRFTESFPAKDELEFRSIKARGNSPGGTFRTPAGVARPRNVIVIVLESVGTKYLSLYSSPYDTTPNLVAESASSLVFEDCYAQVPYTYMSFMAIHFSIYPGLPWLYAPWEGRPCPPSLASQVQPRGWRTAYFHSGDLSWNSGGYLLEQRNFAQVFDYRSMDCPQITSWGVEDRCMIDRLLRWIDEKTGQPFLAVCWTDQTHDPYKLSPDITPIDFFHGNPPPRLADDLSRYLNNVHEIDRQIGRLLSELRKRNLADDTLVVITGDHGEAFCDPHDHRGHSFMIHEEDVKVPLIFWNPRIFASGRRVQAVASHIDINPTIADIVGIEPAGEWQGYSLFDPSHPPRACFMANIGEYYFGIREGEWKFILDATADEEQLFDLSRDPNEQQNVAAREAERCRRFRQQIAAWVSFEEKFLRGTAD